MAKIIWQVLKLGTAMLGASLLVANSTVAAQTPPAQIIQAWKSAATTDQPIDAQKNFNKSIQKQQTSVNSATERLSINPKVVAQNTTVEPTSSEQEQINPYSKVNSADPMEQVTNVSQLLDVRSGDWAYEALRELVERYGCIAGYPDSTYRGNRAMTRYEFAAGLRACLNQIEKLIAANTANATKEDLEKLRRLVQEFGGELATLSTRVDKLENRVGFLETHQFSTTTKLNAEIITAVTKFGGFDGKFQAVPSGASTANRARLNSNTIFSDRVHLNFDTSFTGKDQLRTRLEANNTPNLAKVTGTNESRLSFDNPINNNIVLARLSYRFPLTNSTTVFLSAAGGEFNDQVNTNNALLESPAIGSISSFGRFNPIYRLGAGAGLAVIQKLSDNLAVSASYLAKNAQNPTPGNGLFNGTYAVLGQVNYQASRAFGLGLTYVHSYYGANDVSVTGSTGSYNADQPFGNLVPTSANAYGVEASYRVSPFLTISGWGGLTYATAERGNGSTVRKGNHATSYNYAVSLAFPDLGKKGNLAAIIFGQPPKATRNDSTLGNGTALRRRDKDSAYHIEGLYRYQVTDNISITPGFFIILNPENNRRNSTEYIGIIRTTFVF